MNLRTRRGIFAQRWGGFNPRIALLAALAGVGIGVALLQAGPWRDDTADTAPAPSAAVTAGVTDAPAPDSAALTDGQGHYFTARQAEAARTAAAGAAPLPDMPALTGGEGEFFTGQPAATGQGSGPNACGVRADQTAC